MKKFTHFHFSQINTQKVFLAAALLSCLSLSGLAQTFSTPGAYTVTVPAGVTTMAVSVAGASGGTVSSFTGGAGQTVNATYTVVPGTTYYIYVGAQGSAASSSPTSSGGGEDGGWSGNCCRTSATGGGASDIRTSIASGATTAGSLTTRIIVGGGGGGSSLGEASSGEGAGGAAGHPNGAAGTTTATGGSCFNGGGGGTQTNGGATGGNVASCMEGTTSAGTQGNGGGTSALHSAGGGGGGGGYWGGGGAISAGGGGGSSYYSTTNLIGSPTFAPNTGDGFVTICFPSTPITGPSSVCPGGTIALSNATTGGTWSSSNPGVATVSAGGVVYGVGGGTSDISYSTGSCPSVLTITVATLPAITGPTGVCIGSAITLSNSTTGGVWSSSNSTAATISSGGVVYGSAVGSTNISYAVGSCSVGMVMTVSGSISAITGPTTVCTGTTIILSDPSPGGVWSSASNAIATVSGGVVGGASAGTTNISYTAGACSATLAITVVNLGPITGVTTICPGGSVTLSDATPGGVWSSDNIPVASVSGSVTVTGGSAGTANISYTVGTCAVGIPVTVGTLPAITGTLNVCPGSTTHLSDATSGGVWSSSNPTAATISATGIVYGASAGTTNISYTLGTCSVGAVVTVTTLPAITGPNTACSGSTIALSDAVTGGVWSSVTMSVATVISATGIVTGVGSGTSVISYTLGSCAVSTIITVSGTLSPITGPTTICTGASITLSDVSSGGVWSSDNIPVATVSGLGVVSGVSSGTANISYTVGTCAVGVAVTVTILTPITGLSTVCTGQTITLSDTTPGGVWSSGGLTAATVSPAGVVTGVASGSATISYTVGSCSVSWLVTVGNAVGAISGPSTVCAGSSITLSDNTVGGTWSSGNNTVATTTGGTIHGASAGTVTISYSIGACSATFPVTVDASSAGVITGKDSVCPGPGHVITLSDNVPGGVWSSSSTSRATINPSTGVVSGVAVGTTTIKYIVTSSCGTYTTTYVVHIRTPAQCATGVDPVAEEELTALKVFPNPNGGMFAMNLLSNEKDEEVHVVITNIIGEKVREFITTTNKVLDIKLDHAAGIYLISATTAHGRYVAKVEVY